MLFQLIPGVEGIIAVAAGISESLVDLSHMVPECSFFRELLVTLVAFVVHVGVARTTTMPQLVFG